MTDSEALEIIDMLNEGMAMRGKPDISDRALAGWMRYLQDAEFIQICSAIQAHFLDPKRGQFMPTPADLVAASQPDDGRPSADEAWAMAQLAADESETVVWTQEIAQAWGVASQIKGDQVGARMAFRSAYERLVSESRKNHIPVKWTASLGNDPEKRSLAVSSAGDMGRLGQGAVKAMLPPPEPSKGEINYKALDKIKDLIQKGEIKKKQAGNLAWAQKIVDNPVGRSHCTVEMAKATLGMNSNFKKWGA